MKRNPGDNCSISVCLWLSNNAVAELALKGKKPAGEVLVCTLCHSAPVRAELEPAAPTAGARELQPSPVGQ